MPRSPEAPEDDFRPRDHPVEDDIAFQRKAWKVERVGWACLLVLVVFALLGLFSNGPLSDRRLTTPDGTLQVDDQRFLRQGGRSPLRLALQGEPGATLQVVLERRSWIPTGSRRLNRTRWNRVAHKVGCAWRCALTGTAAQPCTSACDRTGRERPT